MSGIRAGDPMLTDVELERYFAEYKLPSIGRALVREMRASGPVRELQYRMTGVRTRYMSKKMGRPLLAESRTCEFPAIYLRDNDKTTRELWPQCKKFDITVRGPKGKATRLVHTPDLFLIEEGVGFVIEEWREYPRLRRLAMEQPHHVWCDEQGTWHNRAWEEYLGERGITYRLRCSDEHPRIYLSNLQFLEDYSLKTVEPVSLEEVERLKALLDEHKKVPHLSLVHQHSLKADHIFQMVLQGDCYVDLYETLARETDHLVIYSSEAVARADAIFLRQSFTELPENVFRITAGAKFLYDGKRHEVIVLGNTQVHARELDSGAVTQIDMEILERLREENMVQPAGKQLLDPLADADTVLNNTRLQEGVQRLEWLMNPESAPVTDRTLRRLRQAVAGLATPQDQLQALIPRRGGNYKRKLPDDAVELAEKVVKEHHNKAANPKVSATYSRYVARCSEANVVGMSRANFYRWIKTVESVAARRGRRAAYQQDPIRETFDFKHPVHGVLPHEVCYMDHTIWPIMLKGASLPDLGKPTVTLAMDGGMGKARAFWLSYTPASSVSVLMCLRDYVRRNKRLPKVLVLDNGKEFHSKALKQFCSMNGITIRWRRASHPRDSTLVERMLGATETEVISALDGNSLALKDPRNVSSSHNPENHIAWTLPALHGAIEHYLFKIHPNRPHARFGGKSPNDHEMSSILEHGAREHLMVRFDTTLKLMTAPHSGTGTRVVDRMRGVFVDGHWYWHPALGHAKKKETAEVRVELWRASVVYVCFRDKWLIAKARDLALDGRHRPEFELQKREEGRRRHNAAQKGKNTVEVAKARTELWDPANWDERLREQLCEMYYLYSRLEMTEVLPEAKNLQGELVNLPIPKGSRLELLHATEQDDEDGQPGQQVDVPEVHVATDTPPTARNQTPSTSAHGPILPKTWTMKPASESSAESSAGAPVQVVVEQAPAATSAAGQPDPSWFF